MCIRCAISSVINYSSIKFHSSYLCTTQQQQQLLWATTVRKIQCLLLKARASVCMCLKSILYTLSRLFSTVFCLAREALVVVIITQSTTIPSGLQLALLTTIHERTDVRSDAFQELQPNHIPSSFHLLAHWFQCIFAFISPKTREL